MSTPSPLPPRLKYVGPGPVPRTSPFGLELTTDAQDLAIQLSASELDAIAAQLPAPETLPRGALVVLMPTAAASGLRALFTANRPASRAARAGALLARGFVTLGACVDPHTKMDLVWGRAP